MSDETPLTDAELAEKRARMEDKLLEAAEASREAMDLLSEIQEERRRRRRQARPRPGGDDAG